MSRDHVTMNVSSSVGDLLAAEVAGSQHERRDDDLVHDAGRPERGLLGPGDLAGLVLVAGQEPLVEADFRADAPGRRRAAPPGTGASARAGRAPRARR